ncbi:MAG TPA: hypothetical protein VNJ01_12185 [Bacteriovoracaceae bacterium]|nr:hypothetical protein [Bacteriovoracaceae bacterium]
MLISLFALLFTAAPLVAQTTFEFGNDREGTSVYLSSKSRRKALSKALKKAGPEQIESSYAEATKDLTESTLCAYDIVADLRSNLEQRGVKFKKLSGVIYYLRSKSRFDDSVAKLYLHAAKVNRTKVDFSKDSDDVSKLPQYQELMKVFRKLETTKTKRCLDEVYRGVLSEVFKLSDKLKPAQFEDLLFEAFDANHISKETYTGLERARINELEKKPFNLKSYQKKIKSLRADFPLSSTPGLSDFVTVKIKDSKLSRRQRLLETYDGFQIAFMADSIKKLRKRLDADMATLQFFTGGVLDETKVLEPQERFRAAIKLLRMDMRTLGLNSFFKGKAPNFIDLMTAAYELGVITGRELDEIAGLEELWNPKKTFLQKYTVWVRALSSVASLAIPAPFGFIPSLGLMIIEATTKPTNNTANDLGLF